MKFIAFGDQGGEPTDGGELPLLGDDVVKNRDGRRRGFLRRPVSDRKNQSHCIRIETSGIKTTIRRRSIKKVDT